MIEQALKELNPVKEPLAGLDAERAAADLERILTLPRETVAPARRPHHAHGRRLAVIGIASVIAVALVVGLPLLPWRTAAPAFAATPPLLTGELATGVAGAPAAAELNRLAVAAERSSARGRLGSRFATWDLTTRVHGGEPVRSAVVPLEVSLDVAADGAWRRVAAYGRPVAGDVNAAEIPRPGEIESDGTYPRSRAPRIFPERLAGDPAGLREQLAAAHPIDDLGTAELVVALTDLAREQTPGPRSRAAALRLLAEAGDVRQLGPLTDRLGRSGRGFAVDSDLTGLPTRYVLIVDPQTGRLLASEQVLTERAGRLAVEVPAVISYVVFR